MGDSSDARDSDTIVGPPEGVSSAEDKPRTRAAPERPDRMGRYVVLDTLGAGGMGAVYRALDPELDRPVALKVIQARGGDAFRERLRAEARTLAKLNHPNVLAVFDVGTFEGEVFLATEYVPGEDLRTWLREPRTSSEVLEVFVQAGRGLAAAHRAGIIHRDFKPANVMLGHDSQGAHKRRVRVVDFGLAQATRHDVENVGAASEETPEARQPVSPSSASAAHSASFPSEGASGGALTQTGMVMGSPPYMAPELHSGATADASTDQYAFCVSLWEALTGQRPFAGRDFAALYRAKQTPPNPANVPAERAPRWLLEVVARGLAEDPTARWPAMDELLAALAADPARRRRRTLAIAGLAIVVVGIGAGTKAYVDARPKSCTGAEEALAQVWDEDRERAIRDAIAQTGVAYADVAANGVATGLDAYLERWANARTDACLATHERGAQSMDDLSLRIACYDRQLEEVDALIDILAEADETVVRRAVTAVEGLEPLDPCADVEALRAEVPPPSDPEVATAVARLEGELARAKALESAGKYEAALAVLDPALSDAQTVGYRPLVARLLFRRGWIARQAGRRADGMKDLVAAYELGLELDMLSVASVSSAALIWIAAQEQGLEEGKRWAEHASALAEATDRDEARAWVANNRGLIARDEGLHAEALAWFQRAVELKERVYGPDSPEVAIPLLNVGGAEFRVGDLAKARATLERAQRIYETALGPEHPSVASALVNLGIVAHKEGNLDEAIRIEERVIAIWEASLGPQHPGLAVPLANLGQYLAERKQPVEAAATLRRAIVFIVAEDGEDAPELITLRIVLGEQLLASEAYGDAIAELQRSVSAALRATPVHPAAAEAQLSLADALWRAPAEQGRDRDRALELAGHARDRAAAGGEETTSTRDRAEAWLAAHAHPAK